MISKLWKTPNWDFGQGSRLYSIGSNLGPNSLQAIFLRVATTQEPQFCLSLDFAYLH